MTAETPRADTRTTPDAAGPAAADITADGWFTARAREFEAMDRTQLLHEARRYAFDYQQAETARVRILAGARAEAKDARQRLGRVWKLVDPRRRTVPMTDLRMALCPEMYADAPADAEPASLFPVVPPGRIAAEAAGDVRRLAKGDC